MIYRVIHAQGDIETVYLVEADTSRAARTAVLDSLYEREVVREVDGVVIRDGTRWSDAYLMTTNWCAVSAQPFSAPDPIKLYTFNRASGETST